ncbi:MAG TPA: DUF4124 domain-containing protein [Macromonas sp.]|nr:DUF4124 domain-containing protein [Macromonas sp.]
MTHTATRTARLIVAHSLGSLLGLGICSTAWAGSIFTCTDAQGRRITSDRPIAECMDREQRELNASGSVKRVVPPAWTAQERAALEEKQKAQDAQLALQQEERRRERSLRMRYPDQPAHDKARADALAQADTALEAMRGRGTELDKQQQKLQGEMAFYKRDPAKAPVWLHKSLGDNALLRKSLDNEIAEKEKEKARINARFDEELALLRKLWAQP